MAELLSTAWRVAPDPTDVDEAALNEALPVLLRTGSAALAWWRLRAGALAGSAAGIALRNAYWQHALHEVMRELQLPAVLERLRSAGARPLLAKGWAAARLYPEAGLRPYGDFDVYVCVEEHAAARAALQRAAPPPGPVDLHSGFDELSDRDPGELHARSIAADVDGTEVRLLGPEDHLRLLCLHLLRHGAARPLWLCDVAAAIETRAPGFDWDWFFHGSRRAKQALVCTIALAERLLGARLDGVPATARADRLPRWLVTAVLRQWGRGRVRRNALAGLLHRPAALMGELRWHWPNPIEATHGLGAGYDRWPRLPLQLAWTAKRATRFGAAVARRVARGQAVSTAVAR